MRRTVAMTKPLTDVINIFKVSLQTIFCGLIASFLINAIKSSIITWLLGGQVELKESDTSMKRDFSIETKKEAGGLVKGRARTQGSTEDRYLQAPISLRHKNLAPEEGVGVW